MSVWDGKVSSQTDGDFWGVTCLPEGKGCFPGGSPCPPETSSSGPDLRGRGGLVGDPGQAGTKSHLQIKFHNKHVYLNVEVGPI